MRFALLLGALCLLAIGAWTLFHYEVLPDSLKVHCIIYRVTGLYCPGCGASRACYAILHGDWSSAAGKNILLVVLLPFFGLYAAVRSVDWAITGVNRVDKHIPDICLYVVLGIVIVYGIIRNIPVWPFYLLQPR